MDLYMFNPSLQDAVKSDIWLGALQFLTAPVWKEKYGNPLMTGSAHECIDGTTVFQLSSKDPSGSQVTLEFSGDQGCLTSDDAAALLAMANDGISVTFDDGTGNPFDVIFDYTKDNPIDIKQFDVNRVIFVGTVYLRRV